MKVLVLGGTRFFGVHLVCCLLDAGHDVTIATRGRAADPFGAQVERITVDRLDGDAMSRAFAGREYDVVCDNLAYSSNDVKTVLDAVTCGRYVMMSSTAVYALHPGTVEADFRPENKALVWCGRDAVPYDEGKRLAECALVQAYPGQREARLRYPFVLGEDDYTRRLSFYVAHAVQGVPMWVDNLDCPMSLISSREAGAFYARLAVSSLEGPVNGASSGTVTLRQVLDYVAERTGCTAVLSPQGEAAPYNGTPAYSIDTGRAAALGFSFQPVEAWLYPLLDREMERAEGFAR